MRTASQSLECDQVVGVRLVIVEHNKHAGFLYVVHHAVEAVMGMLGVPRRRDLHLPFTQGVKPGQDSSHKH